MRGLVGDLSVRVPEFFSVRFSMDEESWRSIGPLFLMSSPSPLSLCRRGFAELKRRARRTALVMASCVPIFVVQAHDWPEFRGPTGQGISPAKHVPIHWSGSSNVVWKTPLAMAGWSSPVLVKQRLYLTGSRAKSGSSGLELAVLCLDARSGAILWSTNVFTPDNGANIHRKNGYASPTPVVSDGPFRTSGNGLSGFEGTGDLAADVRSISTGPWQRRLTRFGGRPFDLQLRWGFGAVRDRAGSQDRSGPVEDPAAQ